MHKIDSDSYELSTWRTVYANCGLISIARDRAGVFSIKEGYDGWIDMDDDDNPWTADERRELADFMIAQWQAFRGNVKKNDALSQASVSQAGDHS